MMLDNALVDANGCCLPTQLSPIPENDKVKHKLFLEQEQRYSWNSQSRHWSEFVRAWRERCPEPKSSEAFRQWMDDTKRCYQILCAGWERRESEESGFAVDIRLPPEIGGEPSRPANIITTSTDISLLRLSTDSVPTGAVSEASPMPRGRRSAARSSGMYSSLSAEFLADLESLADSIQGGFRPSEWPTSTPSTDAPAASGDGENVSSNSNASSDIGNTAVLFSPPTSSSPASSEFQSYRSSLAVDETAGQTGQRRSAASDLSISPSSTQSLSRENDVEAANISQLVAAMESSENSTGQGRVSTTPTNKEHGADGDTVQDESPILPQRTPLVESDLDDLECESLVILGASFGSGSGPLSSSSGRRKGTLDFILHRTPLESISEELEEAESDPVEVTRQESNSFPLNRVVTPDKDGSRHGQDELLVVRVNSAFSSAASSPVAPSGGTQSDKTDADGDAVSSAVGQHGSERELFPAQREDSSEPRGTEHLTAASADYLARESDEKLGLDDLKVGEARDGQQPDTAGGAVTTGLHLEGDWQGSAAEQQSIASVTEEINLSSGDSTTTEDERECSSNDDAASESSSESPAGNSDDLSGIDVVSDGGEEAREEPLGLRCWFTRERSPSPSLSQPDEPRVSNALALGHRRSRSADLTNARCLQSTSVGGGNSWQQPQHSMSSRRGTAILTSEERELLKIREERESMRDEMLRNRRFAARIYNGTRPAPVVRQLRPIRPQTKALIKEQPLRNFRF
ncbi:hypothetical protein FOZ61_006862 [Perkinsus olseni]|uniref:Uncharacterized protein n=1 Tax=Perkinsus olseni TaxID=32597 RepID=A0A7J6MP42_PEROL|nr:hypothetical protein FOZ61_006862 [Perkinsus olseni]KAF4673369.1 hypothetical protein FOL46_007409 [Perkinsus olseni]